MLIRIAVIVRLFFIGLAFISCTILFLNTLSYFNLDPTYGFLKLKQSAVRTGWYLPFYYMHVLTSGVILLIGFLQLLPFSSSKRFRQLHKFLGLGYVFGVLLVAAPGGLVISLFINRGPVVLLSFLLQSTLWFLFTAVAFYRIKLKDISSHRRWMWRSYAITFAAVTLRLYIFIFHGFMDMKNPLAYEIFSWLSWLFNLFLVEVYNSKMIQSAFARRSFRSELSNK